MADELARLAGREMAIRLLQTDPATTTELVGCVRRIGVMERLHRVCHIGGIFEDWEYADTAAMVLAALASQKEAEPNRRNRI